MQKNIHLLMGTIQAYAWRRLSLILFLLTYDIQSLNVNYKYCR